MRQLAIRAESWPLQAPFRIARGIKTQAETIIVEIREGDKMGRAECVPYGHYGESIETTTAAIEALAPAIEAGLSRDDLQTALLPGAARNAIDCALWDLSAKQGEYTIYDKLGMISPSDLYTAFTLSLDTPGRMAAAARSAKEKSLLKIKLGGEDGLASDIDRLRAIRAVLPKHRLIADANEAWSFESLAHHIDDLRALNLELIEQPLKAGHAPCLHGLNYPFCADESVHEAADIQSLDPGYQWINIKLDKAGGLTEALTMVTEGRVAGKKIMVGCMVASSLAMAPACVLGQMADIIDLDGPLLLAEDFKPSLCITGDRIAPVIASLWG